MTTKLHLEAAVAGSNVIPFRIPARPSTAGSSGGNLSPQAAAPQGGAPSAAASAAGRRGHTYTTPAGVLECVGAADYEAWIPIDDG